MNVLSLFDGISCGQYSLRSSGHKINKYFASEIDQNAIKVTMKNFPDTIQLGDVTKINVKKLPKIDLLIGGSPCQGFSSSGKGLAFDDPRSVLFFEYVRIYRELRKLNPKLKFLLENVVMKKQHMNVITKYMEVEPIFIDSKIFSAQARKRLYWTNIHVSTFPKPSKAVLWDIVQEPYFGGIVSNRTNSVKGWNESRYLKSLYQKAHTVIATRTINIPLGMSKSRYATPIETERLMGLPDNYTDCVPKTHRLHALGNGWECNTIKFLFKNL